MIQKCGYDTLVKIAESRYQCAVCRKVLGALGVAYINSRPADERAEIDTRTEKEALANVHL